MYVGCSGGRDTTGTWALEVESVRAGAVGLALTVGGLKGGHSGLEIDKGRGNAIKIMNRVILALDKYGARLARFDAGNKRNAIPRDAQALVFVPKTKLDAALEAVAALNDIVRAELSSVEPTLEVTASKVRAGGKVFKKALQKKLTMAISAMPHGVIKMSADISWLVETSTNLAVINTTKKDIVIQTSQRSSVASEIGEITQTVKDVFELAGATVSGSDGYPGLEAQSRVADPEERGGDLQEDVRQGTRGEGRARRPRVRDHRREVPRHGHGVVRTDARRRPFARREDLHRHGPEVLGLPDGDSQERQVKDRL